jgi:hypothetical protein
MAHKIVTYELADDQGYEYVAIETEGDLKYMPDKAQSVYAIFGMFERTPHGTLLYTASIEREKDGAIGHCYDSEYIDDYHALQKGNVDIVDRR